MIARVVLSAALLAGLLAPDIEAQDCTSAADIQVDGHSFPGQLHRVGNSHMLLVADDGIHGEELWRWTPDQGASLLADIDQGPGSSGCGGFFSTYLRGEFVTLFFADDDVIGRELWITDGTPEGTHPIDINPGPDNSNPGLFRPLPGQERILFKAYHADSGYELWSTDGTAAGTQLVLDLNPGSTAGLLLLGDLVGDHYVFSGLQAASGFGLYRTDGTATGTTPITSDLTSINHLLGLDGQAILVADDGISGREPYLTDGTPAGTVLLADIHPGPEGSEARDFALRDGIVYFSADDGLHGEELWRSDLTAEGTYLLADLWVGDGGSKPRHLTLADDGYLYFTSGQQGSLTRRLWRTDGTATGTAPVPDLSGQDPANPRDLVAARDGMYFCGVGDTGMRLFFAGGPEAGIIDACGDHPDNPISQAEQPVLFDGVLFYPAYQEQFGRELYRLDEPGAHTLDLGLGDPDIRLEASSPLLGGTLDLDLVGAPSERIGFLVAGPPVKQPHKLFAKQASALWLHAEASQALFLINESTWSSSVAVPDDVGLTGLTFHLQAWFLPDGTYPAAVSNGLQVRLGQ